MTHSDFTYSSQRRIARLCAVFAATGLSVSTLQAQTLNIATSIPPVDAIVQAIGGDAVSTDLIIDGTASPHTFKLKPSHLRTLSNADLIVWVGPGIESFFPRAVEASGSEHLVWNDLGDSDDDNHHGDEHSDEHHGDEHHDDAEHGEEHHGDEHHDDAEHGEEHHGDEHHGHGHDHSGPDPHVWLAPGDSVAFAHRVADALSALAPESAEQFHDNAEQFVTDLLKVDDELTEALTAALQKPAAVLHDAYPRFTAHYDLPTPITLTQLDEESPSASDVRRVTEELNALSIDCVMVEPTINPRWLNVLSTGNGSLKLQPIDPLGRDITPGPEMYFELMRHIGQAFRNCAG